MQRLRQMEMIMVWMEEDYMSNHLVKTGNYLTFRRTREQRVEHYPNVSEERGINCKILFIYKILIYKIYNIEL